MTERNVKKVLEVKLTEDELIEGEAQENKEVASTEDNDAQTEGADAQADQMDVKVITILKDEDTIAAGTWVLISVQPFTSDETLTVSMEDAEVFTVKVTDEQNGRWEVYFDGTLGHGHLLKPVIGAGNIVDAYGGALRNVCLASYDDQWEIKKPGHIVGQRDALGLYGGHVVSATVSEDPGEDSG